MAAVGPVGKDIVEVAAVGPVGKDIVEVAAVVPVHCPKSNIEKRNVC